MQQFTEFIVAWDTEFPAAHNINRCQIDMNTIRPLKILKETGVIMQDNRARVQSTKRVEEVSHGNLLCQIMSLWSCNLVQSFFCDNMPILGRAEAKFIADKWMHLIHGDKFFGQSIRYSIVIRF